jgi:hypothetical protein
MVIFVPSVEKLELKQKSIPILAKLCSFAQTEAVIRCFRKAGSNDHFYGLINHEIKAKFTALDRKCFNHRRPFR